MKDFRRDPQFFEIIGVVPSQVMARKMHPPRTELEAQQTEELVAGLRPIVVKYGLVGACVVVSQSVDELSEAS